MKKKRNPLSEELKEEEGLKTTEKEALEILDYFVMNGVEILRGNPIYVNGLKRLIPDEDLKESFGDNSKKNKKIRSFRKP